MNNQKWFKDFDSWNEKKKIVHSSEKGKGFYFKEREIWWCSLGINIGFEQDGKNNNFERPILILKIFNRDVLWMIPLTSRSKAGKYYFNFKRGEENYSAILSQLRLVSSKRLLRKLGTFPKEDFNKIKDLIRNFIKE